MQLAFTRHGERRRGESDPALTSAGRRMAREAALWLRDQGFAPARIVATPTVRTRETADELGLVFPDAARSERPDAPETRDDWDRLFDLLSCDDGPVALVGHHPTLAFLLRAFGPPPVPVSVGHFAATLRLHAEPAGVTRLTAAWPGRPAL
jgi:phosphohistidine phosphatase SixA